VTSGKYPYVEGKEYYGRGPLRIQGNTEYGAFGEAFGPIKYDSKDRFLNDPDAVTSSGYILFASAMWFYMTPSGLKPSMHDVMTNFWEPNSTDSGSNIE
jgi:chitinase